MKQKVLLSTMVVGVLCGVMTLGVFGLFSATTQNAGNEINTGSVAFTDNDSGSAMYHVTGAKPGDAVSKCIKATYSGSLASEVHLYTTSPAGPLAAYLDVVITQGTQPSSVFPACDGFVADSHGVIYSGTLANFEATHTSYAAGIRTDPGTGLSGWVTGNSVVYKFDVTLQGGTPDTHQGDTSGSHAFIWEARNT